jgi:hypothetical protein
MPSSPSKTLVKLLLLAQEDKCFYCEGQISFDRSAGWLTATVDHFRPKSRGGSKGITNVVLACEGCNTRKGARWPQPDEFVKWNNLAAVWPYIKPFDLEAITPPKFCMSCGQQIALCRLLSRWVSLPQKTQTCSKKCWRQIRGERADCVPSNPTDIRSQMAIE